MCDSCPTCILWKANRSKDCGEISSLSIYIHCIEPDPYNNVDYLQTIVDARSRYGPFLPCQKNNTREDTLQLNLESSILGFGKPSVIHSAETFDFKKLKLVIEPCSKPLTFKSIFQFHVS